MLRNLVICLAAALLVCPSNAAAPASAAGPGRQLRIAVRLPADAPAATAKSFEVTIDKAPARIARVLSPADPQMILLVLDLVGDLGAIEPAKDAIAAEIEKLPPGSCVGVLRAQDGLSVLADPSTNRSAAVDAVRNLTISGRPGLLETLDSVERLADAVGRKSDVRLSVLYITDGNVADYREDFSNPVINSSDPHDLSRRFPEALIQEKISKIQGVLASRQTPLHIVHIAYRADRLNEAYQNGLDQLTGQMAGSSAFCRSHADIPDAIQRAFATVASEYTLIVAAPEHSSGTAQIQVTAGDTALAYRGRLALKER